MPSSLSTSFPLSNLSANYSKTLLLASLMLLSSFAAATEYKNVTLQVLGNSKIDSDSQLLCFPTHWFDVIVFLIGNYVAHAFTVVSRPGEPYQDYCYRTFVALLFPHFGMEYGLEAIFRHACFIKDPLRKAGRAGALVMVVRSPKWRPREGDMIHGIRFTRKEEKDYLAASERTNTLQLEDGSRQKNELNWFKRRILPAKERLQNRTEASELQANNLSEPKLKQLEFQRFYRELKFKGQPLQRVQHNYEIDGLTKLSKDYHLVYVPDDAEVTPMTKELVYPVTLSRNWELAKALIAIFQTIYSCVTLYRARADQLDEFGYAAFGLTVAPYAVMSIVNLVGNVVTPSFAALHLVESSDLQEAAGRNEPEVQVKNTVGQLREGTIDNNTWTGIVEGVDNHKETCIMQFEKRSDKASFRAQVHIDPNARDEKGFIAETVLNQVHRRSLLRNIPFQYLIRILTILAPIIINGSISRFQPGNSSPLQRSWTMSWLIVGVTSCLGWAYSISDLWLKVEDHLNNIWGSSFIVIFILVIGSPAIGGIVNVILMYSQFGSCMRVS